MMQYFERLLGILDHSLKSIDEKMFIKLIDECKNTLNNGGKIVVSGLGKNVPVCEKFVGTMTSLGLSASFMNTNSAVHGDLGMVRKKDLIILLTKSGETKESVYLYSILKKRGCDIWMISFSKDSTLANEISGKIIMELEHEGDMWDIVPNNSTTLNLIVLQALAMRLAENMGVSLEAFKENHPGGHIGELLNE